MHDGSAVLDSTPDQEDQLKGRQALRLRTQVVTLQTVRRIPLDSVGCPTLALWGMHLGPAGFSVQPI